VIKKSKKLIASAHANVCVLKLTNPGKARDLVEPYIDWLRQIVPWADRIPARQVLQV